jgi:hypothetical protein
MDVDEHEILINSTLTYKTKSRSSTFIAVLHFSHNVQLHAFLEIKTETIYNRMDHMLITPAK